MRAILLSLLYNAPTYRAKLAQETSLSTTTITNLIDELMALGVVRQGGLMEENGERRVGRPRSSLCLIPDARYAVGVHLSVGRYRIGIANLTGEIVHQNDGAYDTTCDVEAILGEVLVAVEETIATSGVERDRIIGVGIGVAGLVDSQAGVIDFAPNLGWYDISIGDFFAEGLGLPVIVDNNVKAMALGEAFFGVGRGLHSLVVIYSRIGLGAGIVVNNRILRGSTISAGEIGHTIMLADDGKQCRCGNFGCLETLVSERALVERAEALSQEHPDSLLAQRLRGESDRTKVNCILDAAREGDPCADQAISEVSRYLGYALSNLINLLNPQMILLGGMFAQGEDLFVPRLMPIIRDTAFARLGSEVQVQATGFGRQAGITGAAALALTNLFYLSPEEIT